MGTACTQDEVVSEKQRQVRVNLKVGSWRRADKSTCEWGKCCSSLYLENSTRDVASTTTHKYKYKYEYQTYKYKYLGHKYKYKYLGQKYEYKYKYVQVTYKYIRKSVNTLNNTDWTQTTS